MPYPAPRFMPQFPFVMPSSVPLPPSSNVSPPSKTKSSSNDNSTTPPLNVNHPMSGQLPLGVNMMPGNVPTPNSFPFNPMMQSSQPFFINQPTPIPPFLPQNYSFIPNVGMVNGSSNNNAKTSNNNVNNNKSELSDKNNNEDNNDNNVIIINNKNNQENQDNQENQENKRYALYIYILIKYIIIFFLMNSFNI